MQSALSHASILVDRAGRLMGDENTVYLWEAFFIYGVIQSRPIMGQRVVQLSFFIRELQRWGPATEP